ncbi:MAG: hypothetical protein AAF844_17770 [Pseudomonadota bacterium]
MNESLQTEYQAYFRRAHELRAAETRRLGAVLWNGLRTLFQAAPAQGPAQRGRAA